MSGHHVFLGMENGSLMVHDWPFKSGQVELRNDKDGNIGVSIGKKSFDDEKIMKNYNAVIEALEKEKSNLTIKGDLIKNVFITSSMGVSYKVKLDKAI